MPDYNAGAEETPKGKTKKRSIINMSPRELQEILARLMEKIPYLRRASMALEKARKRVEGEIPSKEEPNVL